MGLGDWIMATVEARRVNEKTGREVAFIDIRGKIQRSEIFAFNPRIVQTPTPNVERILNCGGIRPYIAGKDGVKFRWRKWDIAPGEIYFDVGEFQWGADAEDCVMIEPHVKVRGGNKEWPFQRWQQVVESMPDIRFMQAVKPGTQALSGVETVETPTFRHAMALLANARAFVGCEGGLHHAAAALETPAVVLWSEFIAPEYTGYKEQINIRHANGACGSRLPCPTCRASMDAITPEEVVTALRITLC